MKLLVTRPEEDAGPLVAKLQGLGHEAVPLPLLEIVPRQNVAVEDKPYQALCVSSANGLRSNADLKRFQDVPLFAVGPQSAAAARRAGFTHVSDRGGNVEGLVAVMHKQLKPANGPVLYLSGSETSGDLEGKLRHHGFMVDRVIVYDAVPCAIPGLAGFAADSHGVLLYSPRSAKLWLQQVKDGNCHDEAAGLTHFCLSANVAAALPQNWKKRISPTPDENGMLALLDQMDDAD